jgi:hypothetical protein
MVHHPSSSRRPTRWESAKTFNPALFKGKFKKESKMPTVASLDAAIAKTEAAILAGKTKLGNLKDQRKVAATAEKEKIKAKEAKEKEKAKAAKKAEKKSAKAEKPSKEDKVKAAKSSKEGKKEKKNKAEKSSKKDKEKNGKKSKK